MELYRKMYLRLFNAVTDALRNLDLGDCERAKQTLRDAQIRCEEIYVSEGDSRKESEEHL